MRQTKILIPLRRETTIEIVPMDDDWSELHITQRYMDPDGPTGEEAGEIVEQIIFPIEDVPRLIRTIEQARTASTQELPAREKSNDAA